MQGCGSVVGRGFIMWFSCSLACLGSLTIKVIK